MLGRVVHEPWTKRPPPTRHRRDPEREPERSRELFRATLQISQRLAAGFANDTATFDDTADSNLLVLLLRALRRRPDDEATELGVPNVLHVDRPPVDLQVVGDPRAVRDRFKLFRRDVSNIMTAVRVVLSSRELGAPRFANAVVIIVGGPRPDPAPSKRQVPRRDRRIELDLRRRLNPTGINPSGNGRPPRTAESREFRIEIAKLRDSSSPLAPPFSHDTRDLHPRPQGIVVGPVRRRDPVTG